MILAIGTTPALQRTMTFDRLTIDAVNRAKSVNVYASGKSINVARVLRDLGQEVLASGFLGGDSGRFITADLDRAGIAHDFVAVAPPTRLCITLVDPVAGTATELIEEAAAVAPENYTVLLEKVKRLSAKASAVVMSGTLPAGAPSDFYRRCVELAGSAITVVDAKGEVLRQALAARPTVIKPNRQELLDTAEGSADVQDAIRRLIDQGARNVVVTSGVQDTIVCNGPNSWRIETPKVQVVSPIGSGDAFAAGLAAALSEGQDLPQACCLAVACGASNATTPLAGFIDRNLVDELMTKILAHEM